jgi:hypothetical protein
VVILGGETREVSSVIPSAQVAVPTTPGPRASARPAPTTRAPLGRVVGAVRATRAATPTSACSRAATPAWAWLDAFLTTERLRALLPEVAPLPSTATGLPALRALNFVIHGLLEEGVAASTRQDPQAKSLGEWLRARVVELPQALLRERARAPARSPPRARARAAPQPLLAPEVERALSDRQREILDALEALAMQDGSPSSRWRSSPRA